MRYLLQAVVALGVLIGLPVFLEAPTSIEGMIAAGAGALVLLGAALHGVVHFMRSRRPRPFLDSMLPPKEPPKPPV
jgi:uncharacterized membrane protein (UPF0136 family)